jgi:hypothetical protein
MTSAFSPSDSCRSTNALPLGVDVIIRFHDIKRLHELDRALFSIACQSFSPVRAIVVTQNFDESTLNGLKALIAKYDWHVFGQPEPSVVNAQVPLGDQRTLLLNQGIKSTSHRFLAFLDADDYMYEDAYEYLVGEALKVGAAVTFGGIIMKEVCGFDTFIYNHAVHRDKFVGEGLDDLLRDNFCPLHSFIIDRELVSAEHLVFDERLQRLEDYEFLLRVSSNHKTHFKSRTKPVGVYNWHLDGKNSIRIYEDGLSDEERRNNRASWLRAGRIIWRLKTNLRERLKRIPV